MAVRLVEVLVPEASRDVIESALEGQATLGRWSTAIDEDRVRMTILVSGEATQALLEELEERVENISGARLFLVSVEATVPRPEDVAAEAEDAAEAGEQAVPDAAGGEPAEPPTSMADVEPPDEPGAEPSGSGPSEDEAERAETLIGAARLSTPELYQDVLEMSDASTYYVSLIILSTIVAAFGLVNGSLIAIIGAMVIAPLIGPNVGLSLATTLADGQLARKSIRASVFGIGAALLVSLLLGAWLPVNPGIPEIAGRTTISILDLGLALAAGAAAVLSLTVGVSTSLVGVMVAVALLPPLVAAGLLAGAGHQGLALKAVLLASSNLICINLAGVVTFLVQGVRPTTYWAAERSRRATTLALLTWTAMLGVLVYVVWFVFEGELLNPSLP